MGALIALFPAISTILTNLINKVLPDPEKAAAANLELQKLLNDAQAEAYKAQADEDQAKKDVIIAELGTSWTGNWRSYLMLICGAMIANNWLITPLLNALLVHLHCAIIPVPIPSEAWALMSIGLGGYIGKEALNNHNDTKLEKARIENQPNDKAFFDTAKTMFPNGLTADQVDVFNKALKARDGA